MSLLTNLRFPQLFVLLAVLLFLDVLLLDPLPFVDEMMLGVLTLMAGAWKRGNRKIRVSNEEKSYRKAPRRKEAEKNITPRDR